MSFKLNLTRNKPAKNKKLRQPTCKTCGKRFRTTSAVKKYCSTECGTSVRNTRRRVDPVEKALKSRFFTVLALECKRAGTYQVLHGHTLESLIELYDVYLRSHAATGWSTNKNFSICHIVPVKDRFYLGLLHPQNLVVAPADLNREHGTKFFGHGYGLPRSMLSKKNAIPEFTSLRDIRRGVIDFLGKELVTALVKECKIKPSKYNQDKKWIEVRIDSDNPAHLTIANRVNKVKSGKEMADLKAEFRAVLEGEEYVPRQGFAVKTVRFSPMAVLLEEFARMAKYRPEFSMYVDEFPSSRRLVTDWLHTDDHVRALFDLLHGRSVESLDDELYEIRKVYDDSCNVGEVATTVVQRGYVSVRINSESRQQGIVCDNEWGVPF